ncbi:MAG: ABC transporter substrate-binding protein [Gammaproteobacteria bacterium]|nr:ABC transporter substrate-binding protein [Gammaproteobacteria bacterium]
MTRALALAWTLVVLAGCGGPIDPAPKIGVYDRIVTLSPHLTELVFAVGAGEQLVGISAWSDYPPEALSLPVVGDAFSIDQEQLALLDPDLLLVWQSGTPAHVIDELRLIGYAVEPIRTRGLADVSAAMLRIGELTGQSTGAHAAAAAFDSELQALRESAEGRALIRVFYQVSARPLYTINNEHYVSELIEICGGQNIFNDLTELAPAVSVEAVVDRNPEVMLASTDAGEDGFTPWQRWPDIAANLYGNLFLLPADEIARATPRLVIAGRALCLALQKARSNRGAFGSEQ